VVLDSVAPPDMTFPLYFARDSQRAFDQLTAACAADPGCAQACEAAKFSSAPCGSISLSRR
jgi:hypothetical protein